MLSGEKVTQEKFVTFLNETAPVFGVESTNRPRRIPTIPQHVKLQKKKFSLVQKPSLFSIVLCTHPMIKESYN